jgi:cytidylate kinase
MELVITLSGLHGTGKTTYAKTLSKIFNLRHISAGILFRQMADEKNISISELTQIASRNDKIDQLIDERTKIEAEKGNVIIDGLLAGWMALKYANIKIYLTTPDNIRFLRISTRENLSRKKAMELTLFREENERKRFNKYYKVSIDNLKIYDLILNTELLSIESNIMIMKSFIQEYIKLHGGEIKYQL